MNSLYNNFNVNYVYNEFMSINDINDNFPCKCISLKLDLIITGKKKATVVWKNFEFSQENIGDSRLASFQETSFN